MSCGCGKKKCNGKCGISPSVLQINNNECTLFHKVEVPAVMGDETTNPPKTGAYRNVLLYYEASGNSYLYSSDGIPTKLTGVVSDYEVLTNKPSINGVVLIKNKTLADLGIISAIDSAVADEATARENADNALSDRITTNANNIAANATAISNEVTARTNADNTLSARISGNTTAINNEKTARENADTALSNRITANANAISAETTTRENADNALSGRITANANAISDEKTARENADAGLQDQITAVKATADSAVQPDDIDKTVMSDLAVDSNSSTAQVILKESKVNLKTGATSSEQTSLPVASSSQAGVMNSATYDAVTSNTSNINAIMNGAVAITGLPANPSQSDLTTAWQNETGLSTLINRASVYDVTNNKVWTYYTNDTTWHAASNTSSVTVNTFTNSSEGTIKGSTNIGQVFAENDGTGSVNGWDALSDAVSNNTSKLAGIESGAEVNVQSDWNVSDSSSDAYIKNKPTIGNGTLTIQKNGTTIDTFTANSTTNKTVNITVPTVNDATLTIQKNGDTVQTFTANSSSNKTANIEVPTKTSELDNDAGFIANDTHQVCGEGGNITLDTTTFEPLEMNHFGGNTEQQTYTGKNLLKLTNGTYSKNGVTAVVDNGVITLSGTASAVTYIVLTASPDQYTLNLQGDYRLVTQSASGIYNVVYYDENSTMFNSTGSQVKSLSGEYTRVRFQLYIPNGTNTNGIKISPMIIVNGTDESFEPYVGGTASPNPDYPQNIKTVTGENVVNICGKNLFDINGNFQQGFLGNNGNVSSSVESVTCVDYIETQQNTTYTISYSAAVSGSMFRGVCFYDVNKTFISRRTSSSGLPDSFVTPSNTRYIRVYFYNAGGMTVEQLPSYITNLQLELGSTATAYEPYQGQSYEVNLGKNLFDAANADVKTGYILNNSGVEVSDNTGGYTRNYSVVKPNTTYTISGLVNAGTRRIYYYDGAKNFISRSDGSGASSWQFTTPANCHYVNVQIYTNTDNSTSMASWQIEIGSQATSYADYFTPIELCKIGTYQDSIYKSGEKWYVHKEVDRKELNGSEEWGLAERSGSSNGVFFIDYSKIGTVGAKNNGAFSNYARFISGFVYRVGQFDTHYAQWRFYAPNNTITLNEWKTKLGAAPLVLYYLPATPTDTEITNEALVAQLEALWEADGYDSQTNIALTYAEGNAQGILSVCQYPSHLPVATKSKLGTIIVGHGLDIEDDGRLDVIVDNALSDSSINPVQNKAITTELNSKADISSVPTKTSQLENDSGFVVNDTTEICDEGSDITLNGTLLEPLDVKKIEGATSQQTYSGKNLFNNDTATDAYIQSDGAVTSNTAWRSSQLIKVNPNTSYIWHGEVYGANQVVWAGYNTSSAFVSGQYAQVNGASSLVITTGASTEYLRVGYRSDGMRNMQLELGSTATAYEPYVGGTPAPNPDYPQAVKTVTGENVVQICGKNLLKLPSAGTNAGVTYSINSDGTFNIHGTNNSGYEILFSLYLDSGEFQSVDYTLGAREALPYGLGCRCEIYRGGTWKRSFVSVNYTRQTQTGTPDFTDANRVSVAITIANGATVNIDNVGIQLEKGSSASSFEPYQEQSYPISLGSIELCGLGDDGAGGYLYQDGIYKNLTDNKWYVHKEIGKANLSTDRTSLGKIGSGTSFRGFCVAVNTGANVRATASNVIVPLVCNMLSCTNREDVYPTGSQNHISVGTPANEYYKDFFFDPAPINDYSVADAETWLNNNPIIVYYPLATPTDTEITNEALIEQLNALADADGYEGQTNIFTVSDEINERAILSVCQYPSHLPIATKTKLGAVVVGHGLDIEADGKLDVIVDDDFSTESEHPVQNKVITNALAGKADNTDLSTVAMTGSYDDLTGKPTIPTVNNATLTIQKNGTNVATFTANSSTNVTANITAPVVTMTTTDPGEGGALAANNFIGVYV